MNGALRYDDKFVPSHDDFLRNLCLSSNARNALSASPLDLSIDKSIFIELSQLERMMMKPAHIFLLSAFLFSLSMCEVHAQSPANEQLQPQAEERGRSASVYLGLSLPTGSFGENKGEEGGAAAVGFAIGGEADIPVTPTSAALISLDYSSNPMDMGPSMAGSGLTAETTSWSSLWALIGLKIFGNVSPSTELFGFAQGGMLYGSSPEITLSYGGVQVTQNSASASAFGYGFGAGVRSGRFTLSARYLGGKPEFDLTASAGGTDLGHAAYQQQISCVLITAGLAF